MKNFFKIILLFVLTCSSCTSLSEQSYHSIKKHKSIEVCVTCYHANSDRWTRKGLTSSGLGLSSWKTCAVDPNVFPYGTKIFIPELNLTLVATDTGTDVKSKKASRLRGKPSAPVIDIYIASKSEFNKFKTNGPEFVTAIILE